MARVTWAGLRAHLGVIVLGSGSGGACCRGDPTGKSMGTPEPARLPTPSPGVHTCCLKCGGATTSLRHVCQKWPAASSSAWDGFLPPEHVSQSDGSGHALHQLMNCLFSHRASDCLKDASKDGTHEAHGSEQLPTIDTLVAQNDSYPLRGTYNLKDRSAQVRRKNVEQANYRVRRLKHTTREKFDRSTTGTLRDAHCPASHVGRPPKRPRDLEMFAT